MCKFQWARGHAPFTALATFALGALSTVAACGRSPATDTAPAVSVSSAQRPAEDPRLPLGLRGQVDAYLEASGIAKGPHVTELTIDPTISAWADEAVSHMAEDPQVREALMVVVDPRSGEILALRGRRHGKQDDAWDLAVRGEYSPASVTKTFTLAAALDAGTVRADQRFQGDNGKALIDGKILTDGSPHGEMSTTDMMVFSSNIVAGKMALALGKERLGEAFGRFHFTEAPRIELQGARAGNLKPFSSLTPYQTAALGAGHGFALSPLQVVMGFASVVNDGVYNRPTLVRRVKDETGRVVYESKSEPQRILRHETSETEMRILEAAVDREDAHAKTARIPGCHVAGKTGTGEDADGWNYVTFAGTFPAEKPRLVILAGVVVREDSGHSGPNTAAPFFRRVAQKIVAANGC
ncbi:hypothetical protein LVJ94_31435 [Pendulispora rubella]|uniref:Penicillin-binding protein transpeptidase domain-containing protein n=1 Tax=Pendulispora rubella TaxID=2741070 RepID=A0ABZ2KRY4_9BACT